MNISLSSPDDHGTVTVTNRGEDPANGLTVEVSGNGAAPLTGDEFDLAADESLPIVSLSNDPAGGVHRVTVNICAHDRTVSTKVYAIPFTIDHD